MQLPWKLADVVIDPYTFPPQKALQLTLMWRKLRWKKSIAMQKAADDEKNAEDGDKEVRIMQRMVTSMQTTCWETNTEERSQKVSLSGLT